MFRRLGRLMANIEGVEKSVVGAIGYVLAVVVTVLPIDSVWRALVVAILAVGTTYGIWRTPNTGFVRVPILPENASSSNAEKLQ